MNYADLQTAIIEDTHRADLAALMPRFIRQGEGLINRRLKAYPLRTTITDSDKTGDGIYSLPSGFLQLRALHLQGRQGDALDQVSPAAIRRLSSTADVSQFAILGDSVEFRGWPSSTQGFDLLYYGKPEPLADVDSNDLLTDHEGLYMAAAKFYVYLHTQDRELASDEQDIFIGIMDDLNTQVARTLGGNRVAPTYNFSGGSSY